MSKRHFFATGVWVTLSVVALNLHRYLLKCPRSHLHFQLFLWPYEIGLGLVLPLRPHIIIISNGVFSSFPGGWDLWWLNFFIPESPSSSFFVELWASNSRSSASVSTGWSFCSHLASLCGSVTVSSLLATRSPKLNCCNRESGKSRCWSFMNTANWCKWFSKCINYAQNMLFSLCCAVTH